MNFWEARQAALAGKTVKRIQGNTSWLYKPRDFQYQVEWHVEAFEAEWELVEEPKLIKSYLNVYKDTHGTAWHSKEIADGACNRVGCLEIITDKNGKLISAKNV